MLLYFRIADHFNIIDKPNERSSHKELTIRGGGVIYLVAGFVALITHSEFWIPILGLFIIGFISFLDDRITLSGKIRIVFHLTAVSLLFLHLQIFTTMPWWQILFAYIFVIGIINAYNFMDGINGITGGYSLAVLCGLQYVNYHVINFVDYDLIWFPILATCVFMYFNFRTKAKCFAGDVGSISIAFWIIFLLLKLILKTNNYSYILFLAVYGVDTVLTILHRIILRQNIFDAHRMHFYQVLANEWKVPHLILSTLYALLQLSIIAFIIFSSLDFSILFLIIILPLILGYVIIKPKLMRNAIV
jgi:UDP-N-acetylmuramyl pentapeptide phosphotransferase/UDP-N-acetylglucosamine-1-phosphate transferase